MSRHEDWDHSASRYEDYASRHQLYKESADLLVRAAGLRAGMTVVDLACGTGVVTETILRRLGAGEAKIFCVDFSPEMLSIARRRVGTDGVEFVRSAAEELGSAIGAKVDRVLCNAAFWHFDTEKVFAEIARILKPSGVCTLSLPSNHLKEINLADLYEKERILWTVLEEKNIRGHAQGRQAAPPARPRRTEGGMFDNLARHGLRLEGVESIQVEAPPRDYIDFLLIPIMSKRSFLLRGVPEAEIQDIVNVVSSQSEWLDIPSSSVGWDIYVIRREG